MLSMIIISQNPLLPIPTIYFNGYHYLKIEAAINLNPWPKKRVLKFYARNAFLSVD